MRRIWRALRSPLETRVASRTFLLFALCAALPIVLFAVLGYRTVGAELRRAAAEKLVAASRSYGFLIFDRLQQAESIMTALGQQHLQRNLPLANIRGAVVGGVRIVQAASEPFDSSSGFPSSQRTIELIEQDAGVSVRMSIAVADADRRISMLAEIAPEFLWNDDAVELQSTTLCVLATASQPLHCMQSDGSEIEAAAAATFDARSMPADVLSGEWTLYLPSWYDAPHWKIRAYQSASIGHAALRAFNSTLPLIAALAIVGALLLSALHIRRSHQPLASLIDAARRIGRMRFSKPVAIGGRDEYARLGHAFNTMGARLQAQFSLLSTLAKVDRLILSSSSGARVFNVLLPKLPRLLRCDVAGIALIDGAGVLRIHAASRQRDRKFGAHLGAGVDLHRLVESGEIHGPRTQDSDRDALLSELGVMNLRVTAIEVDSELRGALLLGYASGKAPATMQGHAPGIARRIAVAIRNEEREKALLRQAYFDSLTGLPNRALFKDRLQQEVLRSQDGSAGGALMFVDVDRFKSVNDSLGHSAGDELLIRIAERLTQCMRPEATLARLGGDEFAIIAPGLSGTEAMKLAESILGALRSPLQLRDMSYVAEASVGIALYPQDGQSAEIVLRNADLAMYRAKTEARGQARFFEERMNLEAAGRLELEQQLRAALANGDLMLHFQPIVRNGDRAIMGVEALARWRTQDGAMIPPGRFIPIAEDTGLIAALGEWALREACRNMRAWHESGIGPEYVAVNVSMRQLSDARFYDIVRQCLLEHDLEPHRLEIEITESVLAENKDAARGVMQRLHDLGVRVAIDDFGTGYSSMSMLRQLPFDVIKIDQSFIRECAVSSEACALVQALVTVGHALGKVIVVEGVEQDEQCRIVEALGCDRLQGYLFARPMPAEEMERWCSSAQAGMITRVA